ncbi:MAG: ExeM/NucH family extracellular endonuclease [Herpetosiphon sp.]|nr:ExeM/NucH family extracellular endonuclease [Herpetosiphon sp.]
MGGTVANDEFIELHNVGSTSYDLNGHSVVYRSATGTTDTNLGITWTTSTIIPAGGYYLIGHTAYDGTPTADKTYSSAAMGGGGGGVALKNGATIVDSVGWGTATNAFVETTATSAPPVNDSRSRKNSGCTDTDNNSLDFEATSPSAPRNSSTTAVTCGTSTDTAPTVTSTTPANSAISIAVNSDITINFSEAVTTNAGWYTISCPSNTNVAATESGTGAARTLNPNADFANDETCTVTIDATKVLDQDGTPNAMASNYVFTFQTAPLPGSCPTGTNLVTIPALQGTSDTNTQNNQVVTVRGIVVGDMQGATKQNGFYLQDPAGDGNVATSDGIFVYSPAAIDVSIGEALQVTGVVTEFLGLTEITSSSKIVNGNVVVVTKCGTNQTIAPTIVDLPETTNNDLERYEGMLISIPETLTLNQNFFLGRYGQVTLSSDGRLYNPTNRNPAGSAAAIAEAESNARRLIVLDDAFSGQNPTTIPYIGADQVLRAGDTVTGITGTLDFGPINSNSAIRDYRIQPLDPASITFAEVNARTAAPAAVGGNVKVASFNVLNYFNGNGVGGGFPTSRGATTAAEFTRQRDKIIAAIKAIDADVVGLMEMENDGESATSAIQDLVNGLNASAGTGTYTFVPQPSTPFGTDAIKVALIYKPAKVSLVGASQTSADAIFDRPPFAQTFKLNSNNEKFSVVVNHFKSKGSCPTSSSDPNADQGDGQGCWNVKRVQQAQALTSFINSTVVPTAGDSDILIIGDLNSYGKEDPILSLTSSGFVNEIEKFLGATAYSYVFDGQAGYLDHALASTSLDPHVSGVTEWHINADEPSVIDYNANLRTRPAVQMVHHVSARICTRQHHIAHQTTIQ